MFFTLLWETGISFIIKSMGILSNNIGKKTSSLITLILMLFFLPFLLLALYQVVILYSSASGTPANIVVDAKYGLELPVNTNFYRAFAQGGEEQKNMLAPAINEIKSLKPAQIRIDHLYDYYNVVSRNGSGLSFDFTRLDAVVDSIIETGSTPFFALSYMPPAIAKDGIIINPPNDWNEWSQVVQKTIEHYSGVSGKNLKKIHYEVWNEPDLDQFGSWKYYGDKNYITLYQYASMGANRAKDCNQFYLGGPATTDLYKNWFISLARSGSRIDFFSWHKYEENPTEFISDQKNLTNWLLETPIYIRIPRIISEFGPTGYKDVRYGTKYLAAYTGAVIRQLIYYSPLYLFNFQLKDGLNQTDGSGWGIFTHESNGLIKKPRYGVFNFIDRMSGSLLKTTGEGSWVTSFASLEDKTIKVLLVNFDINQTHEEIVPVTINNLDSGTYKWKINYLFPGGCAVNIPQKDGDLTEAVNNGIFTKPVCITPSNLAILELTRIN